MVFQTILNKQLFDGWDDKSANQRAISQLAIEHLRAEMVIVVQRQASVQLLGGKYWNPDERVQQIAKNVPKMNHDGECDMAVLDNLLWQKPSICSENLETTIMWLKNKPSSYPDSLTHKKRKKRWHIHVPSALNL